MWASARVFRQVLPRYVPPRQGTIVEILDRPERAYLVDFSGGSADPAAPNLPVFHLTANQIALIWRARSRR
jgi:hypothetical protein